MTPKYYTAAPTPAALAGVRVIEMGQLIAGPFCGKTLGEFGADVVKIEAVGAGDPLRNWRLIKEGTSVWWQVQSRNKKSVALDLRQAEAQDIARRLIAEADVLIENFRPGTLEGWGLSPEALHALNPGLVILRISGYGQTGPYRDLPGFGVIGEAMGGWRGIVGEPDRAPSRMGVSIGDTLAATYGCMGALAALQHRERTGQGQVVDSSLYESVLQVMESMIPEYAVNGHKRTRTGSVLPKIAPSNVYPCADGEYLIGANQDAVFARLCAAMGRTELATDARYATHLARGEHQSELDALIGEWTATLTVQALEDLMIEHAVPAGRVFDAEDMMADPHFAARQAIIEVEDPVLGKVPMQGVFPKLSATPGSVRRPAPLEVGQDTADVLQRWLGV